MAEHGKMSAEEKKKANQEFLRRSRKRSRNRRALDPREARNELLDLPTFRRAPGRLA